MHESYPVRRGSDLADLRRSLGIEQKRVAAQLGKTPTTIHRWERAEACSPFRWSRYSRACEAILRGDQEPTP